MTISAGTAYPCATAPIAPLPGAGRNGWIEALAILCAAIAVFAVLLVAAPQARAQSTSDILAALTTDKFPDTERALTEIAASGLPAAPAIIEALAANRPVIIDVVTDIEALAPTAVT